MNEYKKVILATLGLVAGILFFSTKFAWTANGTDYSTGGYSEKRYMPSSGDVLDKEGTAHNEVDDFWKKTSDQYNPGYSSGTLVSATDWTLVQPTATVSSSRIGLVIDAYPDVTDSFVIRVSSLPNLAGQLLSGATDQGQVMPGSDSSWSIGLSTNTHVWAKVIGSVAKRIWFGEVLK